MAKATAAKPSSPLGMNRTGIKVHPIEIERMLSAMDTPLARPSPPQGDESALAEWRSRSIAEAEPVGSVPPPTNLKGALKAGAKMLTGERPQVLLDKMGERLAFERTGVRLYDAFITKCRAAGSGSPPLERLVHFRNEEAKHFQLMVDCMEQLGGDPTAQTPCADVAGVESLGLLQVVTEPKTSVAQSLHAILVAELADNAGWDELILLASKMGQDDMARQFGEAQTQEREHLQAVRKWHQEMTLAEASA